MSVRDERVKHASRVSRPTAPMKLVRQGRVIHYEIHGPSDGPVVLFLHSLGTDRQLWGDQTNALSARFRCVQYDLRGHGLSDAGPPGYGLDDLCEDALALLDELEAPRAHVCGISLGGMIAQRVAAASPARVDRLVLCATALRVGTSQSWNERVAALRESGLGPLADAILTRWFTAGFRERKAVEWAAHRATLLATSLDGYVGACLALANADLHGQAAAIRAPTLVIAGEDDVATPVESVRALCEAVAGARLAVLSGAAHILQAEKSGEITALLERHFQVRPSTEMSA